MEIEKLILIDLDMILYCATYCKKDTPPKSFRDCCDNASFLINNIFYRTNATHVISAFTIGKCFRYNVFPEYKANRPKEKNAFFLELREYLIKKYGVVHDPNLEADDIISIMKGIYPEALVVAEDKDLRMLEGKWYNPRKNEFGETNKEEACRFFWASTILGDDGHPGLKGKGKKFVEELYSKVNKGNLSAYKRLALNAYIDYYEEDDKILKEFYTAYRVLKLLDKPYEGMVIPKPIAINTFIPSLPEIPTLDLTFNF
jgi:hypothetical protein